MLYTLFRAVPAWMGLPKADKSRAIAEYLAAVDDFKGRLTIRTYSTIGIRRDTDFLLWLIATELDTIEQLMEGLRKTAMAPSLENTYSYLAVTRESQYVKAHPDDEAAVTMRPGQSKYLFVYPFVKTREWYLLHPAARQGVMNEHIVVGTKYASVKLNTTYSFGLDDQDFVVAFETDKPEDFLDLVMELRETDSSRYTVRDTPIFTCLLKDIKSTIDTLGG